MEYNRDRDSSGKNHRNHQSHNISFNLNYNRQKDSSQSNHTTESPYTTNKNTQIAEFSVVNPEQSKFIKPVDTAILSMIPERDPDLIF